MLYTEKWQILIFHTCNHPKSHHWNCQIHSQIPPRHNGVVPIKISRPSITTDTAHFIADDSTHKGKEPYIDIIDGIHKIKGRSTVNVIVSNYTNKHLTFHKGKYIRHLEPLELKPIDQEETHKTNSIT